MRKILTKPKSSSKGIPRPAPAGIVKWRKKRFRFTKPKNITRPGFDAFTVKQDIIESGKTIEKIEVVAPETGIHSLAWALSITPQPHTFLCLPIEIRHKIYEYCVLDDSRPIPIIRPRKHGKKFVSLANPLVLPIYNILSLICRQTYVDVVGGGLIYSISTFSFSSPEVMINYLSCINPAHKALIRTLELAVSITRSRNSIPKRVFVTLGSLSSLRDLKIEVDITWFISDVFEKIQDNKHWEMIKGLKKFEMPFTGVKYNFRPYSSLTPEIISAAQDVVSGKVLAS